MKNENNENNENSYLNSSKKCKKDKEKTKNKENLDKDKQNADDLQEEIQEVEKLKKENAELLDKLQRNLAEFDNFRKRTSKEKAIMYDDGVKDTIEKILSVVDNFERALLSIKDEENKIYIGLKMVYKQFEDILKDIGVEPIKCIGEDFDPKLHFAVSHVEDNSYKENEIIEELQKGYKYKDKIIRCSMVKVAN